MKKHWLGAAFVAAFAGAAGVGAGTTVNLRGSDTLFVFTNAIMAACPGTTGPYAGGGSGTGQNAMLAGNQQVAPMSRFFNSGACTGIVATPSQSQGLVVGLDSLLIVGSSNTTGSVACNGDVNADCDPTFEPNSGAAYDTTVNGYTFNGWRDVLRVLLAGFDHSPAASGTGAAAWAARDCNSALRQAIASNYGAFFENHCASPGGDSTGPCTQIRHIFRRDDFSGTTDTVVALLALPAIVLPEASVTLNTTGTPNSITNHTGATPFCNAIRPAFVFPQNGTTLQPTCLQGSDATWDPTSSRTAPACAGGSSTPHETAVYRASFQDNDPIRRPCNGSEQVCSHSKDLGLLLTMNDVEEDAPRTNSDRYNPIPCAAGRFASATPPEVYDAVTQSRVIRTTGLLCPNGDLVNNLNSCIVPSTVAGNTQCLAAVTNAPAITQSSAPVPVAHPQPPGIAEGRAYNQHLYAQVGSAGAYQANGFTPPLPMTGAYYRIHTTRSMNPATSRTCQFADMTTQIGCLVEASPCSIGYAGRRALTANVNTAPVKINKQSPELVCVQGHFLYPFSRKLYFDTAHGFFSVESEELQLTGCMTDLAQPTLGTPAGLVTTNITAAGFIQIPPFVNNGLPFCEDFNERALCGAAVNNDACQLDTPNLDNFPSFETVCGDGIVDAFEDCDLGTLNGPSPSTCSITCRFNN